jgi:hypothetical protein
VNQVPEKLRFIYYLNPMTGVIEDPLGLVGDG